MILLLFPAAYFANLLALIIRALSGYLLIYNLDITFSKLANNIATYFAAIAPKWCAMAVLFLLWPFLSVYWEQYFGGSRGAQNFEIYTVYIVSALIVGLPALLWL